MIRNPFRKKDEFDPNWTNELGQSYLHYFSARGELSGIFSFHTAGADVNLPDNLGMTPLHHAALNGQTEAVTMLFTLGANPDARMNDGSGRTPKDLAREEGHLQLAARLSLPAGGAHN